MKHNKKTVFLLQITDIQKLRIILVTFQFKEINHAHAVLSVPTRRKVYDEYGDMGLKLMEQFGDDGAVIGLAFNPWFKVEIIPKKKKLVCEQSSETFIVISAYFPMSKIF